MFFYIPHGLEDLLPPHADIRRFSSPFSIQMKMPMLVKQCEIVHFFYDERNEI